jgi:type II secretory pathway component PulF
VGEQSGRLADMAGRAGELAARDAERSMSTAVGMLEPALVILLGGFVTFVAAALLQAIYTLRPGAV